MWRACIGLEVHAQLNTARKLFSPSLNAASMASSSPNTHLSSFDLALPGSLPKLNFEAVELALVAAKSLDCNINNMSVFERKHYFYPDLPAGYQITQNRWPIASGGVLGFAEGASTAVNRIQLETDTGKSTANTEVDDEVEELGTVSLDYNRAGAPLIEIVFEPDIKSPVHAGQAVASLQRLLRHVNVCDGKFEMGQMRADLNVSIFRSEDDEIPPMSELNNRVEVKNLNSIKAIIAAAEYEFDRQVGIVEDGGVVEQETRMFDKKVGVTVPMRRKVGAVDYRFMVDPDLPPLILSECIDVERIISKMPELPDATKERLEQSYGISTEAARLIVHDGYTDYFEDAVRVAGGNADVVATYLTNDVFALVKEWRETKLRETLAADSGGDITDESVEDALTPKQLGEVIALIVSKKVTSKMGKKLLTLLFTTEIGGDVADVVKKQGMIVVSDTKVLEEMVEDVLTSEEFEKNLKVLLTGDDRKQEKTAKFFFGKCMQKSKGMADVDRLRDAIQAVADKLRSQTS